MDVTDSDQMVSLCEHRMPLCGVKRVSWEDFEKRTVGFGEVPTTKCFVPTEPTSYRKPTEQKYN